MIMTITGSRGFNLYLDHRHAAVFVVAGYLDGQSRHGTRWQLDKIKSTVIVFLFWITIYYLWEPYQRGYLIQPRSCLRLW